MSDIRKAAEDAVLKGDKMPKCYRCYDKGWIDTMGNPVEPSERIPCPDCKDKMKNTAEAKCKFRPTLRQAFKMFMCALFRVEMDLEITASTACGEGEG
jgi:hypothetical protein